VLRHRFGWKKASMAALQQPSYDTDTLIAVLEQLAGFYAGRKVVLLWDGLSAHWSTRMRTWVDSTPPLAPADAPVAALLESRVRVRESKPFGG